MFHLITKKSLVLSVLLILSCLLSAEQIETINIKGLKRTTDETLLSIIDLQPGDGVTPDITEQVEQKMRKAGIFQEDITVELTPGTEGQVLNITAYDRWTLLGVPFFAASSGDLRGGAFLLDSNLGGKGNFFVSSVLFSQSGDIQAFFLFRDPTFRDSEIALSGRTAGGRASVTYTSLDEKDIWEDSFTNFFNLGTSAGYDLDDRFSLRLGLEGTYRQFEEKSIVPPGDGEGKAVLGWNAGLSFDGTTVFPLFYKGVAANLTGGMDWIPGDNPTWSLSAEARAGWAAGGILLLQASGKGGVTDNPFSSLFLLGGSTGSLTLPAQKIATDRYINGELKGELRLVKMNFGYLTAPVYYEGGYLRDYHGDDHLYHGVGGGLRFYLDKVALPALGLDYRYNMTTELGGVSFFIGMSY